MRMLGSFRFQILLRIITILSLGYLAFYIGAYTPFSLLVFWIVLFALITFFDLVRFLEKINRDLTNFLLAIKQNDFSNVYPENRRNSKSLYNAFNIITNEFIKVRSEKESNFHFFKTIVEHSRVPLIAYEVKDERVSLINEAARELFKIPYLTKLNSITRASQELYKAILDLRSNEKVLIKVELAEELVHLSVIAKTIVLKEKTYKVVVFHNINSELDQQEIESWQKLIRVLTHEIKNSVIPISTLTEVINQMISDENGNDIPLETLDSEDEEDLRTGMRTIEKRSKGLVKFVNSYGDLARVPRPQMESVNLNLLVKGAIDFESKAFDNVKFDLSLPRREVLAEVDPSLIEQVLINVLKNAIEALSETKDGVVKVSLWQTKEEIVLGIQDNGPGIDRETLSNIFVPFYTTKKDGSGIGLPLSRQIMRAHGGNIRAHSSIDNGATFELRLRS